MQRYDVVCVHTIVGNPPAHAAHFSVRSDGHIYQSRDTRWKSAANYEGNHRVIAIENDDTGAPFPDWDHDNGKEVPAFTSAQIEANAKICAWVSKTHGVPLITCPDSRPTSRGVGYHRQGIDGNFLALGYRYGGRVPGGETWTLHRGKVCPGDRRISQIPQIIARARVLAGLNGGGLLADLTDAQQKEVYDAVREMRTKIKNIEAFVEPPDDWKVRVHWLATGLSAMRNTDHKELKAELDELGKKIDALMARVPELPQ
jgi:hypothetical protein